MPAAPGFASILFPSEYADLTLAEAEPDYFPDLNLDQLVVQLCRGRSLERLQPLFWTRLSTVETVHYRQSAIAEPAVAPTPPSYGGAARTTKKTPAGQRGQLTDVTHLLPHTMGGAPAVAETRCSPRGHWAKLSRLAPTCQMPIGLREAHDDGDSRPRAPLSVRRLGKARVRGHSRLR